MSDYTPRAGVDARTRDGRKVTGIDSATDMDGRTIWFGTLANTRGCWRATGMHVISHNLDLVADWQEPVSPAPSAGPVRMVTRPEIVPGDFGIITITGRSAHWPPSIVALHVEEGDYTAPELRAAAETLTQLADAMEQRTS